MNQISFSDIKKWVIIALASDNELMETLVLKGGNAIDLLPSLSPRTASRASWDLDFSIEDDFEENFDEIYSRMLNTLIQTFREHGLEMLDFTFTLRPKTMQENLKDFWGGYLVTFKLISRAEYERLKTNPSAVTRNAIPLLPNQSTKIQIDISKYEYIGHRIETEVEGYTIYIYSPEMIVLEKLRALCQQLPAYASIIPHHDPRPRPRDLYDIELITSQHPIKPSECIALIQHIFAAKRVPLSFIKELRSGYALHKSGWQALKDTLPSVEEAREFDYYFNYTLNLFESLTFPSDNTAATLEKS